MGLQSHWGNLGNEEEKMPKEVIMPNHNIYKY